jgi:hypothetical protein
MPIAPPNNQQFFNSHGISGLILSNNKTSLIIKDEDNDERTVLMSTGTPIRLNFQNLVPADLKANQEIIIIGDPNNQGQIEAKFIRVLN